MVYFLRIENQPFIKIGYTKFTSFSRINGYRTHSPFNHELLLFLEGDRKDESYYHDKFKKHKFVREWYSLSEEIMSFIEDNIDRSMPVSKKEKRIKEQIKKQKMTKDNIPYVFHPKELKQKAFEMYTSGNPIEEIAQFLNTTVKKAGKICQRMGARRPIKGLKYPKGYHHKANKIAYNNKKYKQGKITLEEFENIKAELNKS